MNNTKYLYWHFQTTQAAEPSDEQLKLFQLKYKKDFETRELYTGQELLDKYRMSGWKSPLFSHICGIVLAYEHKGTLRVKYIYGEEKDLIQTFVNLCKNSFQEYELVHFDAEIVLPYFGVRMHNNGFINAPHIGLNYLGKRPWDLKGATDLKQLYKGAGKYSFSIKDMAYIFGLNSDDVIEVEDEFTYYNSGDVQALETSAIAKVELIAQLHRTICNLPQLETVKVEEKVEDVKEEVPKDWLKELYYQNQFTKEIEEGLRQQLKKKRILKKDRENLFTILRGVYVRTDFENQDQDGKAIIEKKEQEINNFLNNL